MLRPPNEQRHRFAAGGASERPAATTRRRRFRSRPPSEWTAPRRAAPPRWRGVLPDDPDTNGPTTRRTRARVLRKTHRARRTKWRDRASREAPRSFRDRTTDRGAKAEALPTRENDGRRSPDPSSIETRVPADAAPGPIR